MIIYLIIPAILFVFTLINPKNKYIQIITVFSIGIFLCTSYFNGSDWRSYELMYRWANISDVDNFYAEKGFYLYMLFFKFFNIDFFNFFIITKLIIYYIFVKVISGYSINKYFILNNFYAFMGLFLFIDCPFRNLIGIGICLIAIGKLEENKNLQFVILVLVAVSFHKSVLFILILLPLKKYFVKIYEVEFKKIIMILSALWIIWSCQGIIIFITQKIPLLESRLLNYVGKKEGIATLMSLGNIEKIVLIVLMIYFRKKIFRTRKEIYLYNYILIYIILYRVGLTFSILTRCVLCLQIFYLIGIYKLIKIFTLRYKILIIFLFFIYNNIIILRTVTGTYKYMPYTSYLVYIGKEKPDFNYRFKYHYLKYMERYGSNEYIRNYLNRR